MYSIFRRFCQFPEDVLSTIQLVGSCLTNSGSLMRSQHQRILTKQRPFSLLISVETCCAPPVRGKSSRMKEESVNFLNSCWQRLQGWCFLWPFHFLGLYEKAYMKRPTRKFPKGSWRQAGAFPKKKRESMRRPGMPAIFLGCVSLKGKTQPEHVAAARGRQKESRQTTEGLKLEDENGGKKRQYQNDNMIKLSWLQQGLTYYCNFRRDIDVGGGPGNLCIELGAPTPSMTFSHAQSHPPAIDHLACVSSKRMCAEVLELSSATSSWVVLRARFCCCIGAVAKKTSIDARGQPLGLAVSCKNGHLHLSGRSEVALHTPASVWTRVICSKC